MTGQSFAELLDEALEAQPEPDARDPRAWACWSTPSAASPFLHARPLTWPAPRWTTPGAGAPRAPHRTTPAQRRAYEQFTLLGATLSAGFTEEELVGEYRRLARRFHPDHHARRDPIERAQLARNFVDLAESYRCLRTLLTRG